MPNTKVQHKTFLEKKLQPSLFVLSGAETVASFAPAQDEVLSRNILYFLVIAETCVSSFWIFSLSGLGGGYTLMAAIPYFYLVVSYTSLWFFYRAQRFQYFIFTQLLMLLVMPFFMQWAIGGFIASGSLSIWAVLSPVGALMILGERQSIQWFLLFVALSVISWHLNDVFASNAILIPQHTRELFHLMNLMGLSSILYWVLRYFQIQKSRAMTALQIEQTRSEQLLLNIFPHSIVTRLKALSAEPNAEEIKNNSIVIADQYAEATILFADLVNFTGLTKDMSPAQLVELLNQVFSRFDDLATHYGLEKIKTLGDAYMVVGGVPTPRQDHAHAVAHMALAIPEVLAEISRQTGKPLSMRIGINSGAVIAGVIGASKFSYDLWGDAVNTAARMEQHGIPGTIQVSESTYQILSEDFVFEQRGTISVKGKGEVKVYQLKSAIPSNGAN